MSEEKNLNSPIDLSPETSRTASPDMPTGDSSEEIDREQAEASGVRLIPQDANPLGGEATTEETPSEKWEKIREQDEELAKESGARLIKQSANPLNEGSETAEIIDKEWQKMREQEEARAEEDGKTLIRQKHNPLGGEPQPIETRNDASSKPENIAAEQEDTTQEEETTREENKEKPRGQLTAEKLEARKEKVERNRDEKYGVDKSSVKWKILKSGVGMLVNIAGSILGARVAWEAPKLVYNYFKKKGQREKLSDTTMRILKEAQKIKKSPPEEISENEINDKTAQLREKHKTDAAMQEAGDKILGQKGIERFTNEANAEMENWYKELAVSELKDGKKA